MVCLKKQTPNSLFSKNNIQRLQRENQKAGHYLWFSWLLPLKHDKSFVSTSPFWYICSNHPDLYFRPKGFKDICVPFFAAHKVFQRSLRCSSLFSSLMCFLSVIFLQTWKKKCITHLLAASQPMTYTLLLLLRGHLSVRIFLRLLFALNTSY